LLSYFDDTIAYASILKHVHKRRVFPLIYIYSVNCKFMFYSTIVDAFVRLSYDHKTKVLHIYKQPVLKV